MSESRSRFPSGTTNKGAKALGLCASVFALAAVSLCGAKPAPAQTVEQLRAGFLNPPPEARPMVRWWWFGPAVVKPEILRELQQMKADGIGGAELAFVYPEMLDDPAKDLKNLAFLSPEMLDAVNYAQAEGRKLGLRIDVTLCSGWPYGGPATSLAEAAGRLRIVEVAVPAGATSVSAPTLGEGESLISASLVVGVPSPPTRRGGAAAPSAATWDAATAQPLTGATFTSSARPRVALVFVASHTKQQVKRAAVGAEGYVLDPFSHDAVATHLRAVGEPLVKAFGATPPYAIFSDSLEAYGADWTPKLPEEFRRRRGYDLLPHLAELAAAGTPTPAIEKTRHDYGKTLTELVNENYLVQINDWAKAHGTRFRSQTYGEPAVSFSSQRLVALPEGEGPQWRAFSTLRWATSANHVFGNNVTSGETYTWLHSPVFRATPLDMKAEADIDFIMGENQLIFHGWPYSAPAGGEPGWSLYAAAALNDHNPWHPVMPAVTSYLTRISWLLRQGQPANQVALLLPTDDAWASFMPGKVTVTGAMQKLVSPELMSAILSAGYNVDFIDADAIESVGLGTHQVLVLPPTNRIPVKTLAAIAKFKAAGGKVITVGKVPSMDAEGKPLSSMQRIGVPVGSLSEVAGALRAAAKPDLEVNSNQDQIGFIRRRLPDADVYFVANTSNQSIDMGRVRFNTAFSKTASWDAQIGLGEDGLWAGCALRDLAPYESRIIVFSGNKSANGPEMNGESCPAVKPVATQVTDLSSGWELAFGAGTKMTDRALPSDWAADSATRNYSGEVIYSRDFTAASAKRGAWLEVEGGTALPGSPNSPAEHAPLGPDGMPNPLLTRTGPGMHAYYDPPIREAALVFINGQAAGALWHPPYRLDVTKLLKAGVNHIEIRVYNTALNAWSALPTRDYGPLKAKYGDRFQMQDLDQVKPLPSGILGTIKLVQERE